MTDWSPLDAALAEAAPVPLWWRDDDAVAATPALDRLLGLARAHAWPLALAAVPALVEPSLPARLAGEDGVRLLVHGLAHRDHAGPGAKRAEFGADRPLATLVAEAERALALAADPLWLPVLVPPWNRIAPALVPRLAGLGYRGFSTYGPRVATVPGLVQVNGLIQVNAHLDPVDWHGGRGLGDPATLVAGLARAIRDRSGPVGLLTHHLVHDSATWRFLDGLVARLARHPSVRLVPPQVVFGDRESRPSSNDALSSVLSR